MCPHSSEQGTERGFGFHQGWFGAQNISLNPLNIQTSWVNVHTLPQNSSLRIWRDEEKEGKNIQLLTSSTHIQISKAIHIEVVCLQRDID